MSKYDNVWDQAHRSLWKVTHNHFFKGLVVGLIVVTMSFWMFKTLSVLVCPAKHRLFRTPPDLSAPARPRHARAPQLGWRTKGRHCQTQRAGGVEKCRHEGDLVAPRLGGAPPI